MKIVKNVCYGGFSLSETAVEELKKMGYKFTPFIKDFYLCDNSTFEIKSENPDAYRAHPDLIKAIEKVGVDKASGKNSKLAIVEVPDDIDWEIEDYDGIETIKNKNCKEY